jgi:molybdopterin molybdotransferase
MLAWFEARRQVLEAVRARPPLRRVEPVPLDAALGRVLAAEALVDRDLPPFDRVTRDGVALRAADARSASAATPARLRVVGEVPAGGRFDGSVGPGECVSIYTGAPMPAGADAVVMVEDIARDGDDALVLRAPDGPGQWVVARGAEARAGDRALAPGVHLGPPQLALLATLGVARPLCTAPPRVAILSTGDEIVPVSATPGPSQIRNSNAVSLAAQVQRAGGLVVGTGHAGDEAGALRATIERLLPDADVLLLSGGVSMGKYDLVEDVLAGLGGRQIWNGVAIRPGKPAVFGEVAERWFFGLPGNPLSTMVTFELFAAPAIAALAGRPDADHGPRLALVRLAKPVGGKPLPLAQFVPARLVGDEPGRVEPLTTQGSGDLPAMARADGWIVVPPDAGPQPVGAELAFLPAR